jgi:hypothetical protein
MADIVEAWKWRDPEEIIEALLRESERRDRRATAMTESTEQGTGRAIGSLTVRGGCAKRDCYYTAARRLHVKRLMKGKG